MMQHRSPRPWQAALLTLIIGAMHIGISLLFRIDTASAQESELHIFKIVTSERQSSDGSTALQVTAEFGIVGDHGSVLQIPDQSIAVLKTPDSEVSAKTAAADKAQSIALVFDAGDNFASISDASLFPLMRTGILQFASDSRSQNIAIIAAADSPVVINPLQTFDDEAAKKLKTIEPGNGSSCVHAALRRAIDILKDAVKPRVILYVAAGPDRCTQEQLAEIGRAASRESIELNAIGLKQSAAQEVSLRTLVDANRAMRGFAYMIDNSNGGNLRDAMKSIIDGFERRKTASWMVYPKDAGFQRNELVLKDDTGRIFSKTSVTYGAERPLIEPTEIQLLQIQPSYDFIDLRLRINGTARIRTLHIQLIDSNGAERASVVESTISDIHRLSTQNLKQGESYTVNIVAFDAKESQVAVTQSKPFIYKPIASTVMIESYSLPTAERARLIITPTIDGEVTPHAWRIDLIDANQRPVGNWNPIVRNQQVLEVDASGFPTVVEEQTFLRIQALDQENQPIPEMTASTNAAIQYRAPSAAERTAAWLSENPLRILIAATLALILVGGIAFGIRLLQPTAGTIPNVTVGTLRTPFINNQEQQKQFQQIYSKSPENVTPCTVSALARAAGGVSFKVTHTPFILGRSNRCDGVIPSSVGKGVSSMHAVLEFTNGVWNIREVNSTYGTLVNSVKIGAIPTPLSNGDEISLGPTFVMSFRMHEPSGPHVYTEDLSQARHSGTARLRSVAGMPADQIFQLRRKLEVLGRGQQATLRLPIDGNAGVSGRHASLEKTSNGWHLRDLDSSNGTFVDGRMLPKGGSCHVASGARIGLGPKVTLILEE
jgi:pSer/pThr/pTyr-binding forkhead associated (FHA) protein